ncbi:MAG: primosomal protein N' [Planctomycetes bacterium]|nr:primosomal protein N' [Planctomycetota bacterium]
MGRRSAEQTGYLWAEGGTPQHGTVAEVAPLLPTDRTYAFAVPPCLVETLDLGQRVRVRIGRSAGVTEGFVVSLDIRSWDSTLRSVEAVIDSASFLNAELVELGRQISAHYGCPLGQTLKAMTPEAVRRECGFKTVRYAQLGLVPEESGQDGMRITPKRQALIERLSASRDPVPVKRLLQETGTSPAILRPLVAAGLIEVIERKEIGDTAEAGFPLVEPEFELNVDQQAALETINERIDAGGFSVALLYGVSGSGKTEVYVRAIRRVLAAGRQAILLVPEIVLTTQLVQRLASRFADLVVSHSGLTDAQRSLMWRRIASGEKKVVVGTRSAVFAPCPNLGLICIDEEQETSYKNLQAPRFNVRDVAIMRAKQREIPVILGSATPAVETWYNSVHRDHYERIVLPRRVRDLPLPDVHLVDMRDEFAEQKRAVVLSRLMHRLLGEALERDEQALILINRRGFARRVFCPECKTRLTCPNCNLSLVAHTSTGQSVCHYCRTRVTTPTACPQVGCGARLIQTGLGTQRVEDVVAADFPEARLARVDSDTMTHRRHYQRIVNDFEERKLDVLVGTQMIAKGLDFPLVSFVGVIDADPTGLECDFRANERLFQLVTQVAGRAGRADRPGRVVVQTTMPELPALRFALKHDYESFVADELRARGTVGLPPFRRLARVVVADPREATARSEAEVLADRVREAIASLSLEYADALGPNPCAMSRLRGKYRYDVLLLTHGATDLRKLVSALRNANALRTKAKSTILDVDPVSLS